MKKLLFFALFAFATTGLFAKEAQKETMKDQDNELSDNTFSTSKVILRDDCCVPYTHPEVVPIFIDGKFVGTVIIWVEDCIPIPCELP